MLEVRGYEALERRVTRGHDEFVAPGEFLFRPFRNASRVGDIVTFRWEMVSRAGGDVAGGGLDMLVLDDDGRIRADYQFIPS